MKRQQILRAIDALATQRGLVFQQQADLYPLYEHQIPGDIASPRVRAVFVGETPEQTLSFLKGLE